MPLQFITFTGPDDVEQLDEIAALCASALPGHIEIAVLVSRTRAGSPRYPTPEQAAEILRMVDRCRQKTAAHVCGSMAREALDGSIPSWGEWRRVLSLAQRIQVNAAEREVVRLLEDEGGPVALRHLPKLFGRPTILQARGQFPRSQYLEREPQLLWLFDESGGRGKPPEHWPDHPGDRLAGYAGGITPENIGEVVRQLGERGSYWLDMETGCRTSDRFDWQRCLAAYTEAFTAAENL